MRYRQYTFNASSEHHRPLPCNPPFWCVGNEFRGASPEPAHTDLTPGGDRWGLDSRRFRAASEVGG